jgi:hypothetical protein
MSACDHDASTVAAHIDLSARLWQCLETVSPPDEKEHSASINKAVIIHLIKVSYITNTALTGCSEKIECHMRK